MLKIHFVDTNSYHYVDESISLSAIKKKCSRYFSDSNKVFFGDNGYEVYRGQLIVCNSQKFSNGRIEEKFTIATYLTDEENLFCLGWPTDEGDTRRWIDYYLKVRQYKHNMFSEL